MSILTRAVKGVRETIADILPTSWMSPLQPLPVYKPTVEARQYDYAVGRNLFYRPRGTERYGFDELRSLARNSELVRLAIETRIDQVDTFDWTVQFRDDADAEKIDGRIDAITDFFRSPDKIHDWSQWLRLLLEELFVTDAVSIYRRRDRGGKIYALELIDGSTIFPLLDSGGRQPLPPDPAYQQILKGVPKSDYTALELIYAIKKTQINTPYGWSAVEQIATSAKTDIERLKYQLSYFTEGSVPDAYVTSPDDMSMDKVLAFDNYINDLLRGNAAGRRQMPVLVPGMEIKQLKADVLKDEFDEWLARKICFAFSLPPTAFVRQLNRSTATSDQQRAKDEGLKPLMRWVKRLVDRIIIEEFDAPDLEFHWGDEEEQDPKTAADIDVELAKAGILSINEIRSERGLPNVPGGDDPMLATATGYVPIDPEAANELKIAAQPEPPQVVQQSSESGNNAGKQQSQVAKPKKPASKLTKKKRHGLYRTTASMNCTMEQSLNGLFQSVDQRLTSARILSFNKAKPH